MTKREERQEAPREKAEAERAGQKPDKGAQRAPEHQEKEKDAGRREFGRDD